MSPSRLLVAVLAIAISLVTAAGVARAQVDPLDAAKSHYGAGKIWYDSSHYEDALREFKEAFRLSKRPALLYDIARCHERLLRYPDAVAALKAYLALDPAVEDRREVEAKIAALKLLIKSEELDGKARDRTRDRTVAAPRGARRAYLPWLIGAAGLAIAGVGAGTWLVGHAKYSDLLAECGAAHLSCAPGFQSDRDLGQNLEYASYALWALGGAAVAASVALLVVEGREGRGDERAAAPRASIAPMLLRGGGGLSAALTF